MRPQIPSLVPRRRLELPRPCGHRYLKPARLPIPPPGHRWVHRGQQSAGIGRARDVALARPGVNRLLASTREPAAASFCLFGHGTARRETYFAPSLTALEAEA